MDPRDLVKGNAYTGPASFSSDPSYFGALPTSNWVVPGPQAFVVKLDPQLPSPVAPTEVAADNLEDEWLSFQVRRRVRREMMRKAASEFASRHGQLLRELAGNR